MIRMHLMLELIILQVFNMKAQFVYEALEFERGGDVKKSIGVGLSYTIKKELLRISDTAQVLMENNLGYLEISSPDKRGVKKAEVLITEAGLDQLLKKVGIIDSAKYGGVTYHSSTYKISRSVSKILKDFSTRHRAYESLDFERGGDPLDTLQIGNRAAKIRARGENMDIARHMFWGDDTDEDWEDPETEKTYFEGKKAFINYGLDFAAILDYAMEQEDLGYWSDVDVHNSMGDVISEWKGANRETFRTWALGVLEYLEMVADIDANKYKKMVERI